MADPPGGATVRHPQLAALAEAAPTAFAQWRTAMASGNGEAQGHALLRLAERAPEEFAELIVFASLYRGEPAAVLLRMAPMEFVGVIAAPPGPARDRALRQLARRAPVEFKAWAQGLGAAER